MCLGYWWLSVLKLFNVGGVGFSLFWFPFPESKKTFSGSTSYPFLLLGIVDLTTPPEDASHTWRIRLGFPQQVSIISTCRNLWQPGVRLSTRILALLWSGHPQPVSWCGGTLVEGWSFGFTWKQGRSWASFMKLHKVGNWFHFQVHSARGWYPLILKKRRKDFPIPAILFNSHVIMGISHRC